MCLWLWLGSSSAAFLFTVSVLHAITLLFCVCQWICRTILSTIFFVCTVNVLCVSCALCHLTPIYSAPMLCWGIPPPELCATETMAIAAAEICQWCGGWNVKFSSLLWWTTERGKVSLLRLRMAAKKILCSRPALQMKAMMGEKICVCIIRAEELSSFLYDDEWWLIIERLTMLTTSRNVLFYQYFRCCCCKIFTTSQFSWLFILSPSMESQRASVYERE